MGAIQKKYKNIESSHFLITRPFGEDSKLLFEQWFDACNVFLSQRSMFTDEKSFIAAVNSKFTVLAGHATNYDKHLFRGRSKLYETALKTKAKRKSNDKKTRAFLLLEKMFKYKDSALGDVQTDNKTHTNISIPSPLFFLRHILTDDDFLASQAYAHAVVRAEIFASTIRSFPPPAKKNINQYLSEAINYKDVSDFLDTIWSYQNKRDTTYLKGPTDFIVAHYLASIGLANIYLSKSTSVKKPRRKNEYIKMSIDQLLKQRSIDFTDGYGYEIRLTAELNSIPSVPQILNALEGIPFPVPGASTVFAGGIRMTDKGGAVVKISGRSGTGKTSLALATCAALAPLGMHTFYLSCEEENEDLLDRIQSVTTSFLKYTRTYDQPSNDFDDNDSWFHPFHLREHDAAGNFQSAKNFANQILKEYELEGMTTAVSRPPGVVPFIVVLDGVHELVTRNVTGEDNSFKKLHELIEHYRKLNVLVILVSAAIEAPLYQSLDYLVDAVVELDNIRSPENSHKPLRTADLRKTRRQFSNTGTHRYHISKRDGVRFYPNLEATLDRFKHLNWKKPNDELVFDFFGYSSKGTIKKHWLEVFHGSQTLITGKGSSGKAGFALRLLTSPIIPRLGKQTELFKQYSSNINANRRCLIISFLYPETYYRSLERRIFNKTFSDRISETKTKPIPSKVLTFYPGYLSAEVMLTKITDELRRGLLQGLPYDSVLIDGIHNVFLQFPELQKHTLIWPMLSETFRRLGMNVITTHAHFYVEGMEEDPHLAIDVRSVSHRSTPLLQALVNSADYYVDVSESKNFAEDGNYRIKVVTAFGQEVPRRPEMHWERNKLLIVPTKKD